jgi:hypothetical protein
MPAYLQSRLLLLLLVLGALMVGGTGLGLALSDAGAAPPAVTCGASTPRLTVQGTGQATSTPDTITAVIGVTQTAPTAAAALSQDNTKADGVVFALTGNGVTRQDIQTTDLTIQAQYAYPKGVPTVTGYQVSNTITATMHEIKKAGDAIDAVVGAAGNAAQINSISPSFRDPAQVESQARAKAVRQAVRHANAMAQAAGRRLGPVCSLTDNTTPPVANQALNGLDVPFGAAPVAAGATSTPVEAGTQSESDQVTIVYAVGAPSN